MNPWSAARGLSRWSREHFSVVVARAPSLEHAQTLRGPALGYWADPFLFAHRGRVQLYCEEYGPLAGRGRIVTFEIDPPTLRAGPPRVVLAPNFHVSYPFVFEHAGRVFMIPETHEVGRVDLYACVEFPHRFRFVRTLLEGVDAADSNLVTHAGHTWLFTSIRDRPGLRRLALFGTEDLLGGKFRPHPINEAHLFEDEPHQAGRCAGPFLRIRGTLVRPTQSNPDYYGQGLVFREVTELTRHRFSERPMGSPVFIHHVSMAEGLFAADFRTRVPARVRSAARPTSAELSRSRSRVQGDIGTAAVLASSSSRS